MRMRCLLLWAAAISTQATAALTIPSPFPSPLNLSFPSFLSHASTDRPGRTPTACFDACAPLAYLAGGCQTDSGACMRKYCESKLVDVFVLCQHCKAKGSADMTQEEGRQVAWLQETYKGSCAERLSADVSKDENASGNGPALSGNIPSIPSEAADGSQARTALLTSAELAFLVVTTV